MFSLVITKIVHAPAAVALILCIVGATNASSPEHIDSENTIHVGVVLYGVVFGMLVVLTLGAWLAKRRTGDGEGLLILAVIGALPFIFVRLLYAFLSAFSQSHMFNPATGSTTAEFFMAVLDEMAVVVIYIATGLKLPAVPMGVSKSTTGTLAYRFGRGDFGLGKLGILSLATAAFQATPESRRKI